MGEITYSTVSREFLLDSHTFLWAAKAPHRLGKSARKILEQRENRLFLSAMSAYEITQKHRLGKLDQSYAVIADRIEDTLRQLGALELPLSLIEADFAGKLDWQHRDPFDRFLAAQAALNNLVLVTNDQALSKLKSIETVW